ncbi:hypothetical protein [Streptomyces sp. NPDC007905]|uniref:hypothetical protein n=1 Tax=Streptomyces sp. NPDC007905 TaxID=3364788 RepID=UPI0036E32676
MKDDEIVAHFDGRGRVHLRFGRVCAEKARRMVEIAHALGYRPLAAGALRRGDVPRFHERDDDPRARRRAERTVERLRAGGPVLVDDESALPPPPPPAPAPPLMPRQPTPRPRRSLEPQPTPPVGPPGPRVPPRPPHPPPPPAPLSAAE